MRGDRPATPRGSDSAATQAAADTALLWACRLAGVINLYAGLVHAYYAPVHFEERHDVGMSFVAVAVLQLAAGILLLAGQPSRLVTGTTLAGTALVVGMYVASRTTGLPLGPNLGEAEPAGLLDLATTVLEAMTIGLLSIVLLAGLRPAHAGHRTGTPEKPGPGRAIFREPL